LEGEDIDDFKCWKDSIRSSCTFCGILYHDYYYLIGFAYEVTSSVRDHAGFVSHAYISSIALDCATSRVRNIIHDLSL